MPGMKRFELLENLSSYGSAKATLLIWSGDRYVRGNQKIVVHDHSGQHGYRGDRGFTAYIDESQQWEAVSGLYEQAASWLPS